jgi:chemotaxis protein histidine kinase CheA
MTQPLGIDDFFVLEAGDYLDRLANLSGNTTAPSSDELVRFTRALRGSALMANQQPIARAAGGLEHLVRAFRDGRRAWDGELSSLVREAVDMLRTLVERARNWTPEDTARAERLAMQLEGAAGGPAKPAPAMAPPPSEAGVRAFLARESAALGSVLDQAARIFQAGTAAPDTLQVVLRRMQPLRGLAALSDFPPLPDVLDGIERTLVGVSRLEISPVSGGGRLEAAARALSRAARDIADRGKPDLEASEFRGFATLLLASEDEEQPAVPIESLFFAGENGIVQRGVPPRGAVGGGMGAAAVVSRGEHLCQAADEIAEATTATQRDLRLHVLVGDLKTLGNGLPTGLEVAVDAFGVAGRAAVARGAAASDAGHFAGLIREAGVKLRGFTEVTQPASLILAFEDLITRLDALAMPSHPVPHALHPIATEAPLQPVPVAVPVDDESDVVPIESLAPDEPEELPEPAPAVVPAAALSPVAAAARQPAVSPDFSGWDLAASYGKFESLVAGLAEAAEIEEIAEVTEVEEVAEVAEVAEVEEVAEVPEVEQVEEAVEISAEAAAVTAIVLTVPPVAPTAPLEPMLVEIAEICYRGRSALERADVVRREILALPVSSPRTTLQPLVDELLDLVELALVD